MIIQMNHISHYKEQNMYICKEGGVLYGRGLMPWAGSVSAQKRMDVFEFAGVTHTCTFHFSRQLF